MISPLKTCLTGLVAAALLSSAGAQTSSSTPVIGYYKQNLSAGGNLLTAGFVNKSNFQGQATALPTKTGTQLEIPQSAAAWTVNQFNTGVPTSSTHYVEILGDGTPSHAGAVLDIISNGTNSVTVLVPASFVVGATAPTYVIRKHSTIQDIFPAGSGLQPFEDLVSIFSDTGVETILQLNATNNWENLNTSAPSNDLVVYPGQGVVVSAGDSRVVTIGGGSLSYVKTTPTRISAFTAPLGVPNIMCRINPLVGNAPTDSSLVSSFNFVGSLAEYEDSVAVLSTDGNLNVLQLYSVQGGVLVDESGNPVPPTATIPNGSGVIVSIGSTPASIPTPGVVVP